MPEYSFSPLVGWAIWKNYSNSRRYVKSLSSGIHRNRGSQLTSSWVCAQ